MMKSSSLLLLLLLSVLACNPRRHSASASGQTPVSQQADSLATDSLDQADPLLIQQLRNSETPSQLLVRKGYVVSYNRDTRLPNWVAWKLTAAHVAAAQSPHAVKRPQNAFHADTDVPEPRADWNDYRGTGWVRGHLCPAADNKWDEQAMYDSFLMTNIVPQNSNLNDGDWNELEMLCRKWAQRYGEVYIVSGPLPYRKPWQTISSHDIVVPRALFKVVLRMDGEQAKAIGFVYKNQAQDNPKSHYVNSLAQVERLTGICFFPALPDDVKAAAADSVSLDDWGIH